MSSAEPVRQPHSVGPPAAWTPARDATLDAEQDHLHRGPSAHPGRRPRLIGGRDFVFLPREQSLTFEELARLARVFAGLGVRKLRLTGGEPLLRRDKLVAMLAAIGGVQDIALTTNGALLASKATALAAAGLRRVTMSLDSLDDGVFMALNDARFRSRGCCLQRSQPGGEVSGLGRARQGADLAEPDEPDACDPVPTGEGRPERAGREQASNGVHLVVDEQPALYDRWQRGRPHHAARLPARPGGTCSATCSGQTGGKKPFLRTRMKPGRPPAGPVSS